MAAIAFEIKYYVYDEANEKSTFSIFVKPTFTLADYVETAIGLAEFIDIVIHGKFGGIADLCLDVDISGLTNNLEAVDSDVEEVGYFQFLSFDGYPVSCNLPGIGDDQVLAATRELDTSDPAIAAFISGMETTWGGLGPTDIAESDIVDTPIARERFRNSGVSR